MRPSPGLVLAVLVVALTATLTRLILPGRGPVAFTVLLSVAGLVAGEVLAANGQLAWSLGPVHPLADVACTAVLQGVGAVLVVPARRAPDR